MYQPFLIADFHTAKDVSKKSWLVPQDAFPTLINGRVRKGVFEKRLGRTLLATAGGGHAIMGIFEARYRGVPHVLVLDTKRVYLYDITASTLTDLSGADAFTGTDADFFRFCTYYGKTYMTNGVDAIYSYDGSTSTVASVSTAGGVAVTACDGLFMFKSRLHLIAPTIGGVYYPDRIYYTDVGLTTITNATQYYIYERDDVPVAYHAIDMNSELIVGRKSAWRAEYTGNTDSPFRCTTVDGSTGSMTPFAITEYRNPTGGKFIVTLSNRHWVGFDGFQFRDIDAPLRDMTLEMSPRYLRYCQAAALTERDALYLTYPTSEGDRPDRILEYGIEENNWSEHTIAMHCVAAVSGEVDPSDHSLPSHHIGRSAIGYTLAGDISGHLFRLDYGDSDNGDNIPFEARSAALNPYQQDRRKAYLGYVDLYADNDANASFTMCFYKDDSDSYYKSVSVSCAGPGDSDKFWQRINVGGECGNFHRIRILNDGAGNRPKIHALCPWMRTGGLITASSDSSASWPEQTWRLHYESGVNYVQRKISGVWTNYQQWGA